MSMIRIFLPLCCFTEFHVSHSYIASLNFILGSDLRITGEESNIYSEIHTYTHNYFHIVYWIRESSYCSTLALLVFSVWRYIYGIQSAYECISLIPMSLRSSHENGPGTGTSMLQSSGENNHLNKPSRGVAPYEHEPARVELLKQMCHGIPQYLLFSLFLCLFLFLSCSLWHSPFPGISRYRMQNDFGSWAKFIGF